MAILRIGYWTLHKVDADAEHSGILSFGQCCFYLINFIIYYKHILYDVSLPMMYIYVLLSMMNIMMIEFFVQRIFVSNYHVQG